MNEHSLTQALRLILLPIPRAVEALEFELELDREELALLLKRALVSKLEL